MRGGLIWVSHGRSVLDAGLVRIRYNMPSFIVRRLIAKNERISSPGSENGFRRLMTYRMRRKLIKSWPPKPHRLGIIPYIGTLDVSMIPSNDISEHLVKYRARINMYVL